MLAFMAQRLLTPNPENASILELKEVARVGSNETALRCTAIQMLIVGISREQVCQALLVTDRALRKWINAFRAIVRLMFRLPRFFGFALGAV